LEPIFRHFGYKNTILQKAAVAAVKRTKISEVMNIVFRGVRSKDSIGDLINNEYDGVKLGDIIDQIRVIMDDLAAYAIESGMLSEEDMITYEDGGVTHYVPRVYNRETIMDNFEFFRDSIVARNLERVYRIEKFIELKEKAKKDKTGKELTLDEIQFLSDPNNGANQMVLDDQDIDNIKRISEAIANKIAYGRPLTMNTVFNPDYQASKNFADLIEDYGTNVPARLKERKLWFIPDAELLGEDEVDGKRITFIDTNIVQVLEGSITSVVKRVEFTRAYGKRGQLFSAAEEKLNEKIKASTGDPRQLNKYRRDLDALRGLFESVAEIVDISKPGTRRFINETPIRSVVSAASKLTTMAVMGLSAFLAVAETGNMFIRSGWKGGMVGMAKFLTTALGKTLKFPGAALGFTGRYTDILEDELVSLGYLHEIGEDISSRARFDPFFDEKGAVSGNALVNIDNAFSFVEDIFYRMAMLEQLTRISQIAAAHASNVMLRGMFNAYNSDKGLNTIQKRELERLGFIDAEGRLDEPAFENYMEFYRSLEEARKQGTEHMRKFAALNRDMFNGPHYRVMSRLISQQITRPNVATRTVWGNSKNPLIRAAYRLRSFTHGYRVLIGGYFLDEAKALYNDKDSLGIAMFITRFLPVLMLAAMTMVARQELSADLHEMSGNEQQAKTIRTRIAEMTPADHILNALDKSGLTMQTTEIINAVEGSKYGSGLFSAVYGVPASRAEKLYDDMMRSAYTGDLSYTLNSISSSMVPAANSGAFDWMKVDPFLNEDEERTSAEMLGYGGYNW
jgi:hypothetical protein